MTSITLLHVSDLHYDPVVQFDRGIVIKSLLADILERRADGIEFDAAIFSGDLVKEGDNQEAFKKVTDAFLDPLLEAAALPRERLILCPGNHDIARAEVVPFIEHGLRDGLKTVPEINAFIDSALGTAASHPATKAVLERMKHYEAFYGGLTLGNHISDNVFFKTRTLNICGYKVGFAAMNSAWRATGREGDKSWLILGERAVDLAIADLAQADISVCVSHHPLDWLVEADGTAIENRLYEAFDIVCFGHTHRTQPRQQVSPLGSNIISQCGTIYESRKYFNGYQIIEWGEADRKATFRCRVYVDTRRVFGPAENVAPGGVHTFELKPKTAKETLTEIELVLRQVRPAIREAGNEHISFAREEDGKRIDFSEAFVCQPLTFRPDAKEAIDTSEQQHKPREILADEVLRSPKTVALVAQSETGRTSLLHHLSIRVSEGVCDQPRIPAIVHMSLAAKAGYEKALRAYYESTNLKFGTLSTSIKTLPWIVFLDDVDGENNEHLELVRKVKADYPSHRIVLVCEDSTLRIFKQSFGEELLAVGIGFLPRKSIRQLSRVRFTGQLDTGMDDPAYNLVMKHLGEASLPRTGYMVALLLWAAEQERLGETLNEAILLENLISFLLGKANFEAALRNQFDPRAQEFLLRAIAVKLREAGHWIEANELLRFIIDYFKSRGLKHGAGEVLEEFLACRLLVQREGYIAFRYPCYQEYFVAADLRQSPDTLKALLSSPDPEALLQYARELDLWSSLSREMQGVDVALLNLLRVYGLDPKGTLSDLNEIKFVGHELQFKQKRIAELLENPPTKDQIDEMWDTFDSARTASSAKDALPRPKSEAKALAEVDGSQQSEVEPHSKDSFARKIWGIARHRAALASLARLVRNCDHEKVEKKKDITHLVLRLWSAHTTQLLEFLSGQIEEAMTKASHKNDSKLTKEDLEKIGNIFGSSGNRVGDLRRS